MAHVPINRLTLPIAISLSVLFAAALLFMGSSDVVLKSSRDFVAISPEVVEAVGAGASTAVMKSVYFEGVPGRELPYRQYTMLVEGQKGSAITVRVRAYQTETVGVWRFQLQRMD